MAKPTADNQADCPVAPAVVVDRFEVKVVNEVIFLTMFGVGIGSVNGPLKHAPAFTAFLMAKDAAQLVGVLQQGLTALQTMKADPTKPN